MAAGAGWVREARASDLENLERLIQSAYRDPMAEGWTSESHLIRGQRTTAAELGAILAAPDSVILVLEDDAGLVGCCHLRRLGEPACYFGLFAVEPARQSSGAGTLLLQAAEGRARRWGCRCMRMQVLGARDTLLAWYLRRGYRMTGERQPFPTDNPADQPLRNDLQFEALEKSLT